MNRQEGPSMRKSSILLLALAFGVMPAIAQSTRPTDQDRTRAEVRREEAAGRAHAIRNRQAMQNRAYQNGYRGAYNNGNNGYYENTNNGYYNGNTGYYNNGYYNGSNGYYANGSSGANPQYD